MKSKCYAKGGAVTISKPGKGSRQETLPHRNALNTLTKGDPVQRSLSNYAKLAPGGLDNQGPSILE